MLSHGTRESNPYLKPSRFTLAFLALIVGSQILAEVPTSDVTVMDKIIVEATRPDTPPGPLSFFFRPNPWVYVSVGDYEILSRCDSEQTVAVARHIAHSLIQNKVFLPPTYLPPLATPMSLIMFNQAASPAMQALIPNSFDFVDSADFGIYHYAFGMAAGGSDVADFDTHSAVQNREGKRWLYAGGGLGRGPIPTGLLFQLSQCRPALPLWYQYGFIGPCGIFRITNSGSNVIIACASWISEAQTGKVISEYKKTGRLPTLPPIGDLLRMQPNGEGHFASDWPSPEIMAEAALFVRWGLYEHPHASLDDQIARRKIFMNFVERSRTEPATEQLFRECFGFGYTEMQERLSRYLVGPALEAIDTLQSPIISSDPDHPDFPNLSCTEASPSQIARIIGDWERMEGDRRKNVDPTLSSLFLKRAGITLHRCYDEGERDPRFLAVLGLYDVDVGAKSEALPILDVATKAGVKRPAAYSALAELRLEEAGAHPQAPGARFSADQLASVLSPLFVTRKSSRLDAKGYQLIAKAWFQSAEKPSLRNLAVLDEGLKLYPFDSELADDSSKTYERWGYEKESAAIIRTKTQSALR